MDSGTYPSLMARIEELRPTQMAVGYEEVSRKRKEWRERSATEAKSFLDNHRFPAVRGPNKRYYIVDHHHLGRALLEENVELAFIAVLHDWSHLDQDEFWIVMNHYQWAHPYDKRGKRRNFSDMPKKLKLLPDDPYRSLAALVRRAGGYPKDPTPFSEFLWADFFRRRIPRAALRDDPPGTLERAKKLARKRTAAYLPDWEAIIKN